MPISTIFGLLTSFCSLQCVQIADVITPSQQSELTADITLTLDGSSEYHHVLLSVAEIPTPAKTVVFDPVDATDNIQLAIGTGSKTVIIPYVGQPWIVRPIEMKNNLRIILEPGVLLWAKENEFHDVNDCVFYGVGVKDVTIIGYGATIRMRKDDYRTLPYMPGEWRHGVRFWGSTDINIFGLTVKETGGDGLYFGPTQDSLRLPCKNVQVHGCKLLDNYRQGISIVAGVDVLIRDCYIARTSGTAPQAGIDVEPSSFQDKMVRISIRNCVVEDNQGSGYLVSLGRMTDQSEPASIVVEDCLVRNTIQPGLRAILSNDLGATGTVDFINCTVETAEYGGARVKWDVNSPIELKFTDCRWSDVGRRNGQFPLSFNLTRSQQTTGGGVKFTNCQLFNTVNKDLVETILSDTNPWLDIQGVIRVFGVPPLSLAPTLFPNLSATFVGAP